MSSQEINNALKQKDLTSKQRVKLREEQALRKATNRRNEHKIEHKDKVYSVFNA